VVLNAAYIKTTITEDKMPLIYLLNMALGGFFGSRLMKDVREKRGLTYGIGSRVSLQNGLFHLQISSQMNSENVDSAISAIQEILTSLQKEGVEKEEFARSKRYFLGQLYRSIDEPHSMLNKVQYSLSKGKALNAFENKCLAVLNADIEDVNDLVNDLFRHSDLAWCLAGDVS
jgi:predicted Zn-dependent peptidase